LECGDNKLKISLNNVNIGVIGLGYVGLPLAVEFGKKYHTVGFDLNIERIEALSVGEDVTKEVTKSEIEESSYLNITSRANDLQDCNVYIVTVPTPVNDNNQPDLSPLFRACSDIGKLLQKSDIVIFESTVYPGATEEDCVPVLEAVSGLVYNKEFYCGYSPERINPGDKSKNIRDIIKVTSGSTPKIAEFVDSLYGSIISAGTFLASSLMVAEAAKVIENTQRDVNIGLINELAVIFSKLGIDTHEVLEAASTKWNFLPFKPGLVGGHCIGVDPYYLTHKAQSVGYHPELILAGRRINDNMSHFIANRFVKAIINKNIPVHTSRILVLGLTFKENCPDLRNSKVIDVIRELESYGITVDCYDPLVDQSEVKRQFGLDLLKNFPAFHYDGLLCAVAHDEFKDLSENDILSILNKNKVVYDLKNVFDWGCVDLRL
jgi:UDP-N-acetyl-D-glucosamine/UDP-N-acetyl-D-galactosamine dehydrogenase